MERLVRGGLLDIMYARWKMPVNLSFLLCFSICGIFAFFLSFFGVSFILSSSVYHTYVYIFYTTRFPSFFLFLSGLFLNDTLHRSTAIEPELRIVIVSYLFIRSSIYLWSVSIFNLSLSLIYRYVCLFWCMCNMSIILKSSFLIPTFFHIPQSC